VPPLEDFSEKLEKIKLFTAPIQSRNKSAHISKNFRKIDDFTSENISNKEEFKGIKKEYNTEKSKKLEKTENPDIPFVKPKFAKQNTLRIASVQEAMQQQNPNTEWMMPSLLAKIEASPVLSSAFQDPEFIKATIELASSKDPGQVVQSWSKCKPHFAIAIREYLGLLGEQFSTLADQKDQEKDMQKNMDLLDDRERCLVQDVMKNREIQVKNGGGIELQRLRLESIK
ncbi:hypothetical protein HK096_006440, partial [Nowakowskiella sp. JEL0078]